MNMQGENNSLESQLLANLDSLPKKEFVTFLQIVNHFRKSSGERSGINKNYNDTYRFSLRTQWGSTGTGNGQFRGAGHLCISESGNIYVSDESNFRIQKFDINGNFITKWGSRGRGNGQFPVSQPPGLPFAGPAGITLDRVENMYVCDFGGHRIQKFDSNGNFITKWGSRGRGNGQFLVPRNIMTDHQENLYVSDLGGRIQKFDRNGNFITKWGGQGSDPGKFAKIHEVTAMYTDTSGSIYASDPGNFRIQKFDTGGNFLSLWNFDPCVLGFTIDLNDKMYFADGKNIFGSDTSGGLVQLEFENISFVNPTKVIIDIRMVLYIVDNNRILVFNRT